MKQPFLIGIGGSHSGIGKTSIAVAILEAVTSNRSSMPNKDQEQSANPLSTARCSLLNKRWGAIKYTKTAFYTSIIDDKSILYQKNKDTRRLLDAGAKEVLWVQSPANAISEVMSIAIDRLSHLDGIIIEGNSAIEFLKPDIVVFINNVSNKNIKPSAERILKQADIVIENGASHYLSKKIHELVYCIEMTAKKKEIENILKTRATKGIISCSNARKIAEEIGVHYKEIGKAANELKIKIKNCDLGCF